MWELFMFLMIPIKIAIAIYLVENEEEMTASNAAIIYYQSFDSHTCPEYPGF